MPLDFALFATASCLVVGVLLISLPAGKYWRSRPLGWFSVPVLLAGVVLMTTFKWREVAIDMNGYKVQIAEAQQRVNALAAQVRAKDMAIAKFEDGLNIAEMAFAATSQEEAVSQVARRLYMMSGTEAPNEAATEKVVEALMASGFQIVPTIAIKEVKSLNSGWVAKDLDNLEHNPETKGQMQPVNPLE